MNVQRANEIVNSPNMIHVTYNGKPVYIQHVDDKNNTARIYPIDEPEKEQNVAVEQLMEH